MGKLPLKEILTVLLISHLSILIAGQLGKPKEPSSERRQTGLWNWASCGAEQGLGWERKQRGKAAPARSLSACEEPERPRSPSRCGGSGWGGPTDPRLR